MTLSYKRDFNISGDKVDITTLNTGRKQYQLRNYNYAKSVLCRQWKYAASKVCRHRNGCYYFHLSLERGVALPNLDVAKKFMGVDVGINHIAVAASTVDGSRFFRGGRIKNLRNCYCGMRARLQSKEPYLLSVSLSILEVRKSVLCDVLTTLYLKSLWHLPKNIVLMLSA